MNSSQASILAQAKQGNANAIVTLLNHKLQSKGITAKVSVKNSCLYIMLEAATAPAQQPLVNFLKKYLSGLTVDAWQAVKVYGRQAGEEIPDWVEEFKIEQEKSQDLTALAKQGDVKAITILINQKLQLSGVTAKISAKNDLFQVMLEAAEVPSQEKMVLFLQSEFQILGIPKINKLKLYGKQSGEDFPDWQEEVSLSVGISQPHEFLVCQLDSNPSSEIFEQASASSIVHEVDGIELSNQFYTALQTTCYEHLACKIETEEEKTIHEIVEDFIDELEIELKSDLDRFSNQVVGIANTLGLQLERVKIQDIVCEATNSNFAGVRLAIRDLERVTREVLQTDFPQETDALKTFFSGAAQEFTAQMFGMTNAMSKEAMVGIAIGSVIAPGVGSVIGAAIGGWFGGSSQKKALEQLVEKYQNSRDKVIQEWDSFLQVIYENLSDLLFSMTSVRLLEYQVMDQAVDFYHQGNEHLEKELEKAIEFYDKAINLNHRLALAWNNKGYALNQAERFEEALPVLAQALQIDQNFVMAYDNYGDTLKGLGRNEDAIIAYKESIRLEPASYHSWESIGLCLYNLQKHQEAILIAHKLVELDSENFSGWYSKAVLYALLEDKESSVENLRKAAEIDLEACQKRAKDDSDLDFVREDERFKLLMESSVGANYDLLKGYLKEERWCEADQETARLLKWIIQKASDYSEVNCESLNAFPCTDLETIDLVWQENSSGRFGFNAQKRIFQESYKDRDLFGIKTEWRVKNVDGNWSWRSNADFDYNSETMPDGYLPSSLWAGEDGWFENRRDRLIKVFARMDSCSIAYKDSES